MKRLVFGIALVLFIIPIFWFKPGFVDFSGDGGRLYFLDPLTSAFNLYKNQSPSGAMNYAMIPYEIFLYLLKVIIPSPTFLIAVDHGTQLALGFLGIYFIVKELIFLTEKSRSRSIDVIAMLSGIVYVGFVTKVGWPGALQSQNQIFLNPLIFYLLLRFFILSRYKYALGILLLTVMYSGNFGYSNMPQILSFYPLALLFLFLAFRFICRLPFPWKKLFILGLFFSGLHAFHILPTIANVFDKGGVTNAGIFSQESRVSILHYFDVVRQDYGKLSVELFQPGNWNGKTPGIIFIPIIAFIGFFGKKSKLLALVGIFFAITFFLVSANITVIGVRLYRQLFYVPGFSMFRSFYEKWYFVYAFFYTLLFAVSFFQFFRKKGLIAVSIVGFVVIASVVYRIYPFLRGKDVIATYPQSNITNVYTIDPHVIEATEYIKNVPEDVGVLTIPLTFPYYQVFFGKSGGAYIGVPLVNVLGGKRNYSGFWSFGPYRDSMIRALSEGDKKSVTQILSLLNVRYIFRNSDPRVLKSFPTYPFYKFDQSIDIPVIDTQQAYDDFLRQFPLTTKFESGYFRISQIDGAVVRPLMYIPDIVYASQQEVLKNTSFRSAYIGEQECKVSGICNKMVADAPAITYTRMSPETYGITVDIGNSMEPFVIVFSDDYDANWRLLLNNVKSTDAVRHIMANGYANAWIIDPVKADISGQIRGTVHSGFEEYFQYGRILSIGTGLVLCGVILFVILKKYVKKK